MTGAQLQARLDAAIDLADDAVTLENPVLWALAQAKFNKVIDEAMVDVLAALA